MAKKYEFRMDPDRSDNMGKLLLTKKQRFAILRWFLFSLVCIVGLLLQDVLLCQVSIRGVGIDVVPCLIIVIAVLQEAESASIFSLAASCIYYFSGSAPGPYIIPIITAVAVFAVIFRQGYLRQGFWAVLLCAAGGMLIYEMSVFGIALFLGQTLLQRAGVMALTALLTLAVVPVIYPVLLSIGKIGGETWKE